MPYTASTKLFTLVEVALSQWSRPDAENPRLSAPISATATTIKVNYPLYKYDGTTVETRAFLFSIKDSNSYTETCLCPAGGLSVDGLTITGAVRGIRLEGLDWTTGDSTLAVAHKRGDTVALNISGVIGALITSAINGTIATGGTGITIGTEPGAGGETITLYRTTTAGVKKGFLRWFVTNGEVQYSDNGTDWVAVNDVTASDLAKVSAADTTAGYLNTKITVDADTMTKSITSPAGDERLELTAVGGLADMIDDVTATKDEINQALDGISVNVTYTKLNTLTAGAASDADALHTHNSLGGGVSLTAGENITGATTAKAVAIGGTQYKKKYRIESTTDTLVWTGGAESKMGEADANTRQAQSFIYTNADASAITIDRITLMIGKVGAPTDNVYIEIQTDAANVPSGTVVTNGTSAVVSGAGLSTTAHEKANEFTLTTEPTITSGTKYWIVFRRSTENDAGNYYVWRNHGSSLDANGTSSGYTASTATWSAESTTDFYYDMLLTVSFAGRVFLLDTDNLSKCRYIGFVTSTVTAGNAVNVQTEGVVSTLSGLSPGDFYCGSTTGGGVDDTPSGANENVVVPVGEALSATSLLINRGLKIARATYNNVQVTQTADAVTINLFVELGFKPVYARLVAHMQGGANHFSAGRVESVYGTEVEDINMQALANAALTVTAQSVVATTTAYVGDAAASNISFGTVYENGIDLVIKEATSEYYPNNIEILAYGY